jgi:O-antigen/teichoic acid export membrane protein
VSPQDAATYLGASSFSEHRTLRASQNWRWQPSMLTRIRRRLDGARTHQGFRRYFANTSWMLAEQILRLVTALLVGIWVARYLGPAQFGVFSYAVAFAALFSSVAKLGLDGIVVRDLVREPSQRDVYLGTAFWLKLVGAFVMLVIITLATQLTSNDATTNLYIFIIASGAIFQSFEVVDFYFQSRVLSKFVSLCKLSQLLISSMLKLYLILIEADLIWFVLVSLVDQVTLALSFILAFRYQKISSFYRYFDRLIAKQLFRDSWPMVFSGFVIMIYMRIDQIMIKEMLGDRDVGLYSVAVRLSEMWYFIPLIITNSLFPAIVGVRKISKEIYYARLQRLYTLMVWMALGLAIPMTFLSNWLVTLLYGAAYKEASAVLMIHIWAGVFVFYGCARGQWLLVENLQTYGLICTSIGAITNIVLNLILIGKMGITGAAIATFLSYGISSVIIPLFFPKDRVSVSMFFKTFLLTNIRD